MKPGEVCLVRLISGKDALRRAFLRSGFRLLGAGEPLAFFPSTAAVPVGAGDLPKAEEKTRRGANVGATAAVPASLLCRGNALRGGTTERPQ